MSIEVLNTTDATTDATTNQKRYLYNIEDDIKTLFVMHTKDQNRQQKFNNLIMELSKIRKPNSDLNLFTGFNMRYFRGLFKDAKIEKREKIKELVGLEFEDLTISNLIKMAKFIKNCPQLKPQYNGLEVVFKDSVTDINLIRSKTLRFD